MPRQRLFHRAVFHTGVAQRPTAMLVRGERILALGDRGTLRDHLTGPVEEVDLGGAYVVPGLVDAHIHTGVMAREASAVDLRGVADLDEALVRIRTYAASLPEGGWVLGGRWDSNTWHGPERPDRWVLDDACAGRPAALSSVDGHTVWANSAALAAAGIARDTPDPVGGEIVRRTDGEPAGLLRETAVWPMAPFLDAEPAGGLEEQLLTVQDQLLALGLTGVHCLDGEDVREAYQRLHASGRLAIRVHKSIPMSALDRAIEEGRRTGDGDDWFSTGPVKLFADGALGSRTSHMNEAFADTPGHSGIEVMSVAELSALAARAAAAGIAVATHAIGDRANQHVLDAYETLRDQVGVDAHGRPLRHRIEHAQHLLRRDVERAARLGVVASMQPTHCTTDSTLAAALLGNRDLASYAWRSFLAAGACLALGSDAPVEPAAPMYGVHAAVTRQARGEGAVAAWQPAERLTVDQALAGFSAGPARAAGQDRDRGRLEAGMLADFTALDADPHGVGPSALQHVRVSATAVGGALRYRRD